MSHQRKETYDPGKCQQEVYVSEGGWPRYYQCSRRPLAGTQHCKQHQPDAIEARRAEADKRHQKAWRKRMMEFAGPTFFDALKKIADGDNNPRETAREAIARFMSDET